MGKIYEAISGDLKTWIEKQKIFFVATAPLKPDGHINLSPKGLDTFRILSPTVVAYQDMTGSGVETIAHVKENGRIVIMFCAFEGPPKIVRLHGKGEIILPGSKKFNELTGLFPERIGTRAIVINHVKRIQDSCGYGVPIYEFKKDRDVMEKWASTKGDQGILDYQQQKNTSSIDGLPAI